MELIVKKLAQKGIVSFVVSDDKTQCKVEELVDQCSELMLTKDELVELATELLILSHQMK